MAVADTVQSIKTHLQNAYAQIEALDGVVPANKNLESLTASIATLSENTTTIGPWGRLIYVTGNRARHVALQSEEEFNALCTDGDLNSTITIQNRIITKHTIIGFTFGADFPTAIPHYFLYHFVSVGVDRAITIPNGVAIIGNYFMASCSSYAYAMALPSSVTRIGTYFRSNNNSATTLTNLSATQITTIPLGFHASCRNIVTGLKLPNTLTSIGNNFLNACSSYNESIDISSPISSIGNNFLNGCSNFNNSIRINGDNGTIGYTFANGIRTNSTSSSPKSIDLTGTWKSIGDSFLANSAFLACPVNIAGDSLTIGNNFLAWNTNMSNNTANFTGTVVSIGAGFMQSSKSIRLAPTGLDAVKSVGNNFLYGTNVAAVKMPNLETAGDYFMAESGTVPTNGTALASFPALKSVGNYAFYKKIGGQFTPSLPALESVGTYFCSLCTFTSWGGFPKLTDVGTNFMGECFALQSNSAINIPATLTTQIPAGFLFNCPAITKVMVPNGVTFASSSSTLAVQNRPSSISYTNGITLSGAGAAAAKEALTDLTTGSERRKLIVVN